MRNPWPYIAVASCLTLVGATMALAPRARVPMQVTDRNGFRHFTVRRFGLFPVVKSQAVPGLDATAMVKSELARLHLKLPPKATALLAESQHAYVPGTESYNISGYYAGTPKDAYNDFRSWFGKGRHTSAPQDEQVYATCLDKRTHLSFIAQNVGGPSTHINIALHKPWQGKLPLAPN